MKRMTSLLAAVALMITAASVSAEEVKSGLKQGERIGAFDVVKCAGAEDDGVAIGKTLCYRCKYGTRPMVMVFTRNPEEVAGLVKKLDGVVAQNSDKGLKDFVNVLANDREVAEKQAKKIGQGSKNVPVVVPVEFENGPANYGINPKVATTVIIAENGKVTASLALDSVDEQAASKILSEVQNLVK